MKFEAEDEGWRSALEAAFSLLSPFSGNPGSNPFPIQPERVLNCDCSRCTAERRLLEAPIAKLIETIDRIGAWHRFSND